MSNFEKNLRLDIKGSFPEDLADFERIRGPRNRPKRDETNENRIQTPPVDYILGARHHELEHPDARLAVQSLMTLAPETSDPRLEQGIQDKAASYILQICPHVASLSLQNQYNTLQDITRIEHLNFKATQRICHEIRQGYNSNPRALFLDTTASCIEENIERLFTKRSELSYEGLATLAVIALSLPELKPELCGRLLGAMRESYSPIGKFGSTQTYIKSTIQEIVPEEIVFNPIFWRNLGFSGEIPIYKDHGIKELISIIGDLRIKNEVSQSGLANRLISMVQDPSRTCVSEVEKIAYAMRNLGLWGRRSAQAVFSRLFSGTNCSLRQLSELALLFSRDREHSHKIWNSIEKKLEKIDSSLSPTKENSLIVTRLLKAVTESLQHESLDPLRYYDNIETFSKIMYLARTISGPPSKWSTAALDDYIVASSKLKIVDPQIFTEVSLELLSRLNGDKNTFGQSNAATNIARAASILRECTPELFEALISATKNLIDIGDLAMAGKISGQLAMIVKEQPWQGDQDSLLSLFLELSSRLPNCTHHWPDRSSAFTLTAGKLLEATFDSETETRLSMRAQKVTIPSSSSVMEADIEQTLLNMGYSPANDPFTDEDLCFARDVNLGGWHFDFVVTNKDQSFTVEVNGNAFHSVFILGDKIGQVTSRIDGSSLIKDRISRSFGLRPISIWSSDWTRLPRTGSEKKDFLSSLLSIEA